MASELPVEVLDLVEFRPVEDLMLSLLRERLPGITVRSLIEDNQVFPSVMIRANGDWGSWSGDPRFLDSGQVNVQVYCDGLNADSDAALLSEAVRVILRDGINKVVPGVGHLTRCDLVTRPRLAPDWATATGPVQYADLPTGVVRYETIYDMTLKRAL